MIFRYQLSGSIFIGWFLVFYYSSNSASFSDIATKISALPIANLFSAVAAGIPIGTIIHQISVSIKNQILGKLFGLELFVDSMVWDAELTDKILKKCIKENRLLNRIYNNPHYIRGGYKDYFSSDIINDKIRTTHEKLSLLNTHYYLRFDNGVLAPVFAYLAFILVTAQEKDALLQTLFIILLFLICLFVLFVIIIKFIKFIKFKGLIYKYLSIVVFILSIIIIMVISYFVANPFKEYYLDQSYFFNKNTSNISITFPEKKDAESMIGYCCAVNKYHSSKTINYSYESTNNILNFESTSILEPESSSIEQVVISTKDNKKVIITPIDSNLLTFSWLIALLYMTLMVSYIPTIYRDRKECYDHYRK